MADSGVTVKWSKTFAPHVPGEGQVLGNLGKKAAKMIKGRITGPNKDSTGRPIRPLSTKARNIDLDTPEGRKLAKRDRQTVRKAGGEDRRNRVKVQDGDVRRRYVGGKNGDRKNPASWATQVYVSEGYKAIKKAQGKRPIRDLSLTGKLWRSMAITVQGGGQGKDGLAKDRKVKVGFRGSDKSKKVTVRKGKNKGKQRSLPMREKARLAFYGRANGKDGDRIASERASMMRLSDAELDKLTADYIGSINLFR